MLIDSSLQVKDCTAASHVDPFLHVVVAHFPSSPLGTAVLWVVASCRMARKTAPGIVVNGRRNSSSGELIKTVVVSAGPERLIRWSRIQLGRMDGSHSSGQIDSSKSSKCSIGHWQICLAAVMWAFHPSIASLLRLWLTSGAVGWIARGGPLLLSAAVTPSIFQRIGKPMSLASRNFCANQSFWYRIPQGVSKSLFWTGKHGNTSWPAQFGLISGAWALC